MPITPTRSVGCTPCITMGLNTVMPPQNSGPADSASIASGKGSAQRQWQRTFSAKPPWRPTMVSWPSWQRWLSPPVQGSQCMQLEENQPRPTRWPTLRPSA